MRIWAALLLAGCASRTTPPPLYSDPAGSRMTQVVAFMDGRPITLGEVVQTSIDTDYTGMLRRHFLRLVIEKEVRDIQNTPDELHRFAQAKVSEFKTRNPTEFRRALEASKKSEDEYTRVYASSPALNARLQNEKAVVYAILTKGAALISIGKELWVFPGMLEKEFGKEVEQQVFAGRSTPDVKVIQVQAGAPRPYSEIAGEVMVRVLAEPLSDATIEAYFDWLLSRTDIRTKPLERPK